MISFHDPILSYFMRVLYKILLFPMYWCNLTRFYVRHALEKKLDREFLGKDLPLILALKDMLVFEIQLVF